MKNTLPKQLGPCFDHSGENRCRFGPSSSTFNAVEYEVGPDESVSLAVVRAVSAVEGREPDSLPPLADVLGPDALDGLFAPRSAGAARTGGRISFVYSRCSVTIDNGEYLTLQPLESRLRQVRGREASPGSNR